MKLLHRTQTMNRAPAVVVSIILAMILTGCANLPKKKSFGLSAKKENSKTVNNGGKFLNGQVTYHASLAAPKIDQPTTDLKTTKKPKEKKQAKKHFKTRTLKSVLDSGFKSNPDVAIAKAQQKEAEIAIKIARSAYYPTVDVLALTGKENTYATTSQTHNLDRSEVNLQVRQTLVDFGESKYAVERREKLFKSATNRQEDASEQFALDVLQSYLNYLRQDELGRLAAENITVHKEIDRIIRLNEQAGNGTLADVKRVETRLDSANSAKLDSDNQSEDAITAFKRLTEIKPQTIKRPKNIIPKNHKTTRVVSNNLVLKNPRLKSLALDIKSLEDQLVSQHGSSMPKIYGLAEANYKNDVGGDTDEAQDFRLMIGMSWKAYDGGKKAAISEQISARLQEADARYKKLHRELTENFDNNHQELKSSVEKLKFLQSSAQSARKVMKLYKEQFKGGQRTAFEILDAQRDLFRAEQDLRNHKYDTALAYYRDLRIQGTLLNRLESLL